MHLCGKGKIDNLLLNTPGYKQFEYIKTELKDLFAMADIVISRAGANAICELLALKKPNILIPLPAGSSRGDQLLNAASFEAPGLFHGDSGGRFDNRFAGSQSAGAVFYKTVLS